MVEKRTSRGLPLPSVGQMAVIFAALVAAWLVSSGFGRTGGDSDDAPAGSSVDSFHSIESSLNLGAAALPELLAALDSDDPQVCSRAAYGLGRLGPTSAPALEKLLALLAADNPRVRGYAAFAVARVQPDKDLAAAAIAPLLADAVSDVRDDAAKELLDLGAPAFQPTVELLQTADVSVRLSVVKVLKSTRQASHHRRWLDEEPKISQVIRGLLDDVDPAVRDEALCILAEWNQASPAEVGKLLRNEEAHRVVVALQAVVGLKSGSAELLPEILELFDRLQLDEVGAGRTIDARIEAVLSALSSLGIAARPAAPRLLQLFEKCKDRYWLPIAETLVDIGADRQDVIRIVSPLLLYESRGRTIAWQAGELLLKVSPGAARQLVSQLIPKLADGKGAVDKSVLHALYALGPQAQEAVPALIPLLHDSDPWVAEFAANAFSQLGPTGARAVPDLANVVKTVGRPGAQRLACAGALASMGDAAHSAVPALLQWLSQTEPGTFNPARSPNNAEWRLRAGVVRALGRIKGDAAGLMPALHGELSSKSPDIRAAAAEAVGRVGCRSSAVLAELLDLLQDDSPEMRATAALAIGRMAVDRKAAVAPLIRALADDDWCVEKAAAVALGEIGPPAGDALPLLRAIVADPRSGFTISLHTYDIPELDTISLAKAARAAVTAIAGKSAKDES